MGRPKVYIDGKEGTTGLQIYERLAVRSDIELLLIEEEKRKDTAARKVLLNEADLVFLCLPDQAAREAVALISNDRTRVIDASTAHRTHPDWVYGFPELSHTHRERIVSARRVANPGCHASGFISIVYPLIAMGLLSPDTLLSCVSLTGYSGGGKQMIARYESADRGAALSSPALYAMTQGHKHLPEMQAVCGLAHMPVFVPVVDDYYKGMATTVPFHREQLQGVSGLRQLWQRMHDYYQGRVAVCVAPDPTGEDGYIDSGSKLYGNVLAGRDDLVIVLAGNDRRFTVTALFDNLGKGASGAAVQNMNLMLGFEETAGLSL